MDKLHEALRAGRTSPPAITAPRRLATVVAGGAGTLGAALLEQLAAGRDFAPLRVLVTRGFHASMAGLEPLCVASDDTLPPALGELAVVVFDRARHANGRDAAFLRPQAQRLPQLAAALRAGGVRDLLVVMPQASATLPQALQAGLANLDEHAVAALGFERVVFMHPARPPDETTSRGLQRVADLVLAQLRLMTPQNRQPVRATKLAQVAAALARALPQAPAGTRVMPAELVWQAAQLDDAQDFVRAWLAGEPLPEARFRAPRM